MTNLQVVELFAQSVQKYKEEGGMVGLEPKSLFDYYVQEKAEDAWTDPREFH